MHRGAKARDNTGSVKIADHAGLFKWLLNDRAAIAFDGTSTPKRRAALKGVVRAWVSQAGA
ncbi:hypothetical protein PHYC_00666 [Phycisphaerales bacterium]|nr:hypothetical protein PHYC_00666 [Phycisphaerales bacterium]